MPPIKVYPQRKAALPVKPKTCERCDHVFRSKRKAVESDSVKLARKAKDKLHKARKRTSETRERTLHRQNAHGKHESELCLS